MISHRTIKTNGISMHIAEAGQGPPVILCHGFPELWYSWRHQLPALAQAGYHAIALDQRGYGGTDAPEQVEDYEMLALTGDLVGVLDAIGEESAVFVGHDLGALNVWQLSLLHPDRVRAVVAMSVPFYPRGPVPMSFKRTGTDGPFFYISYFQDVGVAEAELDADPRAFMRKMLTGLGDGRTMKQLPMKGTRLSDVLDEAESLPAWLDEADLDVCAAAFAEKGFRGPLNWYRNYERNWERTAHIDGAKVSQPALFIAGEQDMVLRMIPVDRMAPFVPDLRQIVLLPGAGHWIQQERPEDVNRALLDFLGALGSA